MELRPQLLTIIAKITVLPKQHQNIIILLKKTKNDVSLAREPIRCNLMVNGIEL